MIQSIVFKSRYLDELGSLSHLLAAIQRSVDSPTDIARQWVHVVPKHDTAAYGIWMWRSILWWHNPEQGIRSFETVSGRWYRQSHHFRLQTRLMNAKEWRVTKCSTKSHADIKWRGRIAVIERPDIQQKCQKDAQIIVLDPSSATTQRVARHLYPSLLVRTNNPIIPTKTYLRTG